MSVWAVSLGLDGAAIALACRRHLQQTAKSRGTGRWTCTREQPDEMGMKWLVLCAVIGLTGCARLKPGARPPETSSSEATAGQLEAEIQATLGKIRVEERLITRSKELLGQDLSPEMERAGAVARESVSSTEDFMRARRAYLRALQQRLKALEAERSFYHDKLYEEGPQGPRRKPTGSDR